MSLRLPPTPIADPGPGDAAADATLLGASASSPVDVDMSPMMSTAKIGRTRAQASRSDVWWDMDEVKMVIVGKEVRCGAICNYCKICLSAPSTGGTGHLLHHIR
jgi:hypothetical protein